MRPQSYAFFCYYTIIPPRFFLIQLTGDRIVSDKPDTLAVPNQELFPVRTKKNCKMFGYSLT